MHRFTRLLMCMCSLVRTLGAERIVNVYYLENARKQWDLITDEMIRIAAPIPVLVMMTNDWQYHSQRTQRLANVFSNQWVLAHQAPFLGREQPLLFQNLIGDRNSPEIVEEASAAQRKLLIFAQTHEASQRASVFCQAFAMTFGVGITRLDASPQGAENRVGVLQLVGIVLDAQQRSDSRK